MTANEKKRISDHQAEKKASLKRETTLQILSFAGLCIAFGIGLYRTMEMWKSNNAKLKNLD